ncbi:MAG TPA: YbgF trimerization domain-containing protein, partial [Pseudoxanthomonas sp.]|nr:YbgF trimerization domain-containing protein [Pseudoxanthomonas sp.]
MRLLSGSILVIAAALAAAAPAYAQRQSLADRVAALEIQSANDRGNTDLLNQVTQLRTEMQQMRELVEQLQNENEKLKQTARD